MLSIDIKIADKIEGKPATVASERAASVRQLESEEEEEVSPKVVYYERDGTWYILATADLPELGKPTDEEARLSPANSPSELFEFQSASQREPTPEKKLVIPPTAVQVMSAPCQMGMRFSGQGGVKVEEFLRWMDAWFATMGRDFDGAMSTSRRRQAGQITLAIKEGSAAWKFMYSLPQNVFTDEDSLRHALVERFHDDDMDGRDVEDITSMVRELKQGDRDMFWYSRQILKILKRKPIDLDRYDKLLITYYIEGLTSRRLRETAILKFCGPDSTFTPVRAVKDMMRYGRQIKEKGYKRQDESDDDDDDDDGSSDEEDFSDSDSDSDDDYVRRGRGKSKRTKAEKARKRSREKLKVNGKKKRGDDDDDSVRGEVRKLREIVRDLVKAQKQAVTPGTSIVANRPENDIIPLETYNMGDNYGRYPPPSHPEYHQYG